MISITGIDDIDIIIYDYKKDIDILESLGNVVQNTIINLCHNELDDNDDWVDIVSSRKFGDNYYPHFRDMVEPYIDEYLSDINMKMSDFEHGNYFYYNDFLEVSIDESIDESIYETIMDYRFNRLTENFYNCNKCNVWLTPEYESKEECLCCNCVVYSDDDKSSE